MVTRQREVFLPAPPPRCGLPDATGAIVVCADRGEDLRVPSTSESDPSSSEARHALDNGVPRAPNVSGLPDCSRGCVGIGGAPPPVYLIDLSAIPDAPEGSDADKVARGEMSDR